MSSTVTVFISTQANSQQAWKASSALVMGEQGATVLVGENEADNLRKIQKAGRQLDNLGVNSVTLVGDGWDLDRQWAFSNGYTDTMSKNKLVWANSAAELEHMRETAAWVRELVNLPPNEIYPESLAQKVADKLTALAPEAISVRTIKGDQSLEEGRYGIHAVGRASKHQPLMLVLDYNPSKNADAPVEAVLVGKGITFDSGGYSIKSSEG